MDQESRSHVRVGTCGFGQVKDEYAESLNCVEIQHTFYKPPQIKTLERWRASVPAGFEFTLKAWQMITHESASPTYRRLKRPLTDKEVAEAGAFKPTETVMDAWRTTLDCGRALKARTVLFQCPAKFTQTDEHIADLTRFFNTIDRGGLNCAWEPRGPWDDAVVKKLCLDLDLWHVVDPFKAITVTPSSCYFRLHGIGGWRYKYDDAELEELASLLPKGRPAYVFFNNNEMFDDAARFRQILEEI